MSNTSHPTSETGFDRTLRFTIPDRDCRGRIVRLGPTLDTILAAHDYAPAVKLLLAEALVLTSLMGALLKDDQDQLTLQAQTRKGAVDLLVCDYQGGELRGYIQHDAETVAGLGANPDLNVLFGEGFLAITFDIADGEQRYQGVVPLEGNSLSAAVEAYFAQSEQVPTLIRTGVISSADGCIGSGLLVQHLPEGEDGRERLHARLDHPEWEHIEVLAGSVQHDELIDASLSLETIVWRLFHEEREVRVEPGRAISRGCRCSEIRFEQVLSRFPAIDRKEMRNDDGLIVVDCAFCSKEFAIQD